MDVIDLETAKELKDAGLEWQPQFGDRFAVPDRGLDDQLFVINEMTTIVQSLYGRPAITFHGTSEWALDYLLLGEAVWLPTEGQLRTLLQARLAAEGEQVYDLIYIEGGYTCRFTWQSEALAFSAPNAGQAYAAGLAKLLG